MLFTRFENKTTLTSLQDLKSEVKNLKDYPYLIKIIEGLVPTKYIEKPI